MIITVAPVGMVEVPVDEIVCVITVRDAGMATAGGVEVAGRVALARMARRAAGGVRRIDSDRALINVVAVHHVEMAVVEIVDVAAVLHREVAAVGAVGVVVRGVLGVLCHEKSPADG
jgi:hypothetical protein